MPELPEVEIIKNELKSSVVGKHIGKTFKSNFTFRGKHLPDISPLLNETILNIYRRNKYLIIEFKNHYCVIHLGMTGQVIYTSDDFTKISSEKHVHLAFKLNEGTLYFKDIRRFGGVSVYSKVDYKDYLDIPLFKDLGIEPLSKDFTLDAFKTLARASKGDCKKFLMNGSNVCGLGNIYANEVLFLSNINPAEAVSKLTDKDIETLYMHIKNVLNKAIELGGSSISDFVHTNGLKGSMQNFYKVYSRENEACFICDNIIVKTKQHGRSSFYCPCCQSLK